jgi:betaine lipid synthase
VSGGFSGLALKMGQFLFRVGRVQPYVKAMFECNSVQEQRKLWTERLKPAVSGVVAHLLLDNTFLSWHFLGVPKYQRKLFLEEGLLFQFT